MKIGGLFRTHKLMTSMEKMPRQVIKKENISYNLLSDSTEDEGPHSKQTMWSFPYGMQDCLAIV